MIQIAVAARQGATVGQPMAATFGPAGGTIGRTETNTLVLQDPDRTVSRVHAQVVCRNGLFFIVDRGSNAMQTNGRALGAGNEAPLLDGDRLVIGTFELVVTAQVSAAPPSTPVAAAPASAMAPAAVFPDDDPFADLLAGLSPPAAPSPSRPSPVGATPAPAQDSLMFPDPMGARSTGGSAHNVDPFADLLAPAAAPSAGLGGIEDFADLGIPVANKQSAGIDALFGDMGAIGGDPLALSPLADPLLQPNTAGNADPLAALQRVAPPTAPPRQDHLPAGQFAYTPPKALPVEPDPGPPVSAASPVAPAQPVEKLPTMFDDMTGLPIRIVGPAPAAKVPAPSAAVVPPASIDDTFSDLLGGSGGTDGLADLFAPAPSLPSVAKVPAPAPSLALAADEIAAHVEAPAAAPDARPPVAAVVAPPPSPAAGRPAGVSDDLLLQAFLRGLAGTHQPPQSLTPELLERVGSMLRSATEGTLQLLLTRQEFKREVRAEVTMIAAQANNPLKFSPTVEVALSHLLGPGVRGFMPAEAAMRDAFQDLRAHQFGVMVGMRAALAHVIARFAPDELEKKIAAKSALDNLFSANRKAKLWDQFVALYGGIATEAEDDFHSLFGKAFLSAYEEQMARLKANEQESR